MFFQFVDACHQTLSEYVVHIEPKRKWSFVIPFNNSDRNIHIPKGTWSHRHPTVENFCWFFCSHYLGTPIFVRYLQYFSSGVAISMLMTSAQIWELHGIHQDTLGYYSRFWWTLPIWLHSYPHSNNTAIWALLWRILRRHSPLWTLVTLAQISAYICSNQSAATWLATASIKMFDGK